MRRNFWKGAFCLFAGVAAAGHVDASILRFGITDFGVSNVFNRVRDFNFRIDLTDPLLPGAGYENPDLNGINYLVDGRLTDPTPSGFPAFRLVRNIGGTEFYDQGSLLNFAIRADAVLNDGLQFSELADLGGGVVLRLYAREVDTGRYHPPELVLRSDGTGQMRNADNTGGINPSTKMEVDVEFGEEYIADLTFDPATTISTVPLPPTLAALGGALIGTAAIARRRKRQANSA